MLCMLICLWLFPHCFSLSSSSGLSLPLSPLFYHTSLSTNGLLASSVPFSLCFVLILSPFDTLPFAISTNSIQVNHTSLINTSGPWFTLFSLPHHHQHFSQQHCHYIIRNVISWVPSRANYSSQSLWTAWWIYSHTLLLILFA